MKKLISAALGITMILCFFSSCGAKDTDALGDILNSYKKHGLSSWWEAVAIYGAGENPAKYKGFKELRLSLEGQANLKMASYVTVASIAAVCGEDIGDFDKYEEYKSSLKDFLENPIEGRSLNDYIFSCLALKCSGTAFDEEPVLGYLIGAQKPDGGFSISPGGESGDVDVTAFAVFALHLMCKGGESEPISKAMDFLAGSMGSDGTFSSYGNENSNSTACALSAFIIRQNYAGGEAAAIGKASNGLSLFLAKGGGYSFLKDGEANQLATAQAAIALGDLKNNMSAWERLYRNFNS